MVSTDLPYTYLAKGRYWRFRHRLYGDAALPGKPGDAEFHVAYAKCMEIVGSRSKAKRPGKDTFAWLIESYLRSPEFGSLADATQLDYGKTCVLIKAELGAARFAYATRAMLKAVRDEHAATARKAHKIKQMLSRLYSWADENDLVPEGFNPASGIKKIKAKGGTKEYTVWSSAEFDLFVGGAIEPMKTAAMLARYTGQRVRDLVKMVWSDFQGDVIRVRQSKTGAPLMIACHSSLRAYLESIKRRLTDERKRGLLILTNASGQAYNANSLSSAVNREVRRIDGMPIGRSLHGLRYMSGSDMEEAGCTVAEIEAVLGHQTFKMALKYASQRLRAKAAIEKMEAMDKS